MDIEKDDKNSQEEPESEAENFDYDDGEAELKVNEKQETDMISVQCCWNE